MAINCPMLWAVPESIDPTLKRARPKSSTRFRPNMSASLP